MFPGSRDSRWPPTLTLSLKGRGFAAASVGGASAISCPPPVNIPFDEEDLLAELPGTSLCHPCRSIFLTVGSIGQLHAKLHGWTNRRPRHKGTVPRTPNLSIAKLSSDAAIPNRGWQQVRGKAGPANVQIRGRPRPAGARPEEVVQSQEQMPRKCM